jgi:hypothetical protein
MKSRTLKLLPFAVLSWLSLSFSFWKNSSSFWARPSSYWNHRLALAISPAWGCAQRASPELLGAEVGLSDLLSLSSSESIVCGEW